MKTITAFILFVSLSLSVFAEYGIATWSATWFPAGYPAKTENRKADVDAKHIASTAQYISSQNPDILVMTDILDTEAALKLVTDNLNGWKMNAASAFTQHGFVPPQQIAVISRHDAVDSGTENFKKADKVQPPRGFVWAVFNIDGKNIGVIGCQLKSNYVGKKGNKDAEAPKNRAKREEAAKQIRDFADKLLAKTFKGKKVESVYVAGDFNMSLFSKEFEDEETIEIFKKDGFKDTHADLPQAQRMDTKATKNEPEDLSGYILVKGTAKTSSPAVAEKTPLGRRKMLSVKAK